MRARGSMLVVALVALAVPREAAAAPSIDLAWDAPLSCPSRDRVLADIADVARGEDARARVSAVVRAPSGSSPWSARLVVERGDERGERTLEAESCEALSHALALVVALAIAHPGREPPPPRPAPSPPPPSDAKERTTEGAAAPPRGQVLAIGAGATATGGIAPEVAPGAEVGVVVRAGPVDLGVRGALHRATTASLSGERATASFTLATFDARAMLRFEPTTALALGPYAGIGAAYLRGEGRGALANRTAVDWLPLPFAGGEARLRIVPRIDLYLDLDAAFPLGRSRFAFDPASTTVHEPSPIAFRGALGVRAALF